MSVKNNAPRACSTGVCLALDRWPERGLTLVFENGRGGEILFGKVEKERADLKSWADISFASKIIETKQQYRSHS
jgi:hypothetical protein